MKIFILFALVSISVCQDNDNYESPPVNCVAYGSSSGQGQNPHSSGQNSGSFSSSSSSFSSSSSSSSSSVTMCDSPYDNEHAGDKTCIQNAVENVPALTQSIQKLICKYKNHQVDRADEFYKGIKDAIREIARCAGCKLDDVLGTGETLENTTDAVGAVVGDVLKAFGETLSAIGVAEPLGTLLCNLIGGTLTSKCLEKITNSDISALTDNLKKLSCMGKEEKLDVKLTVEIMRDVGCLGDDTLDTDVLANLTERVGNMLAPPLRDLIDAVLALPVVGPVVSGVLCTVTQTVDGLLNGGDGGLLGGGGGGLLGGGSGGGGGGLLSGGGGGGLGGLLGGGGIGRR